ncbi:MAG: hypothetical protein OEU48_00165 [Gammaproteobacteria bacterium]|jgi:hypothetical protein|nr:hypothetical protein [Gammaproteobacteria bacterium]
MSGTVNASLTERQQYWLNQALSHTNNLRELNSIVEPQLRRQCIEKLKCIGVLKIQGIAKKEFVTR